MAEEEKPKTARWATSIYVTQQTRERLDALAKEEKRTRSNMVAFLVEQEYERREQIKRSNEG